MQDHINLLDLNRNAMERLFVDMGEKSFRAAQVVKWVYQMDVDDFDAMTNLSKPLRAHLRETASIAAPEVATEQISGDGTVKWLLRIDEHNCIETVFIPEPGRGTLCVSSQVGCPLDCSFCSTGKQGFNRNLGVAQIVGQLWQANRRLKAKGYGPRPVTNVVFMGMGEPLLNFENVVSAIHLMMDDLAYGLSRRRVTVSTAGVIPGIDRLKDAGPVSLAISLHAPNDALRDRLVPINRKYPIDALLAACRRFVDVDDRHTHITFEYVMLDGVNDTNACAHQLGGLLRDLPAKVNLIPFNPFPKTHYRRSEPEVIDRFREILMADGIITVTRKTRGDDIDAACGQLVGKVKARGARRRLSGETAAEATA